MINVLLACVGVVVIVVTMADLFLTVFTYDGFHVISTHYQRLWWRVLCRATSPADDLRSVGGLRRRPSPPSRRLLHPQPAAGAVDSRDLLHTAVVQRIALALGYSTLSPAGASRS